MDGKISHDNLSVHCYVYVYLDDFIRTLHGKTEFLLYYYKVK